MSKAKKKTRKIKWLPEPEEDNYPAAESYLKLMYSHSRVKKMVTMLRAAPVERFKAKDMFRASQLSPLGVSNSHVQKDQKKIKKGTPISPLLLVRDEQNGRVVIADGYHRLCAVYRFDEDAWIDCKLCEPPDRDPG